MFLGGKHVNFNGVQQGQDREKVLQLVEQYKTYKDEYAKNILFNSSTPSLSESKILLITNNLVFSAETIRDSPLQLVQIFLDTATYDEIERDVKMTVSGQLGLIGGTMGLLTGFSILSGVEIVYFAVKLIMSLRIPKGELAAKARKAGNQL